METSPRTRVPAGWAPPPPLVIDVKKRSTPPPLPPADAHRNAEAEFEDTLGFLVDHFRYASLPPAEFGAGPELEQAAPEERGGGRSFWWWGAGSLIVGAVLAGGVIYGMHLVRGRPAERVVRPEVPIVVKAPAVRAAAVTPQVEPLAEEASAQSAALPAEPEPAVTEHSAPAAEPVKKVARRKAKRSRAAALRRAARATAASVADSGSGDDNWEDPFR